MESATIPKTSTQPKTWMYLKLIIILHNPCKFKKNHKNNYLLYFTGVKCMKKLTLNTDNWKT